MRDNTIWVDIDGYNGVYRINASGKILKVHKGTLPTTMRSYRGQGRRGRKITLTKKGKQQTLSVEKLLRSHINKIKRKTHRFIDFEIQNIIKIVSDYYNIYPEIIKSKGRSKFEVTLARQMCHKLAKDTTKLSLSKIGTQIGYKDHTTVGHSCKAILNLIETDKKISYDYYTLLNIVKNDTRTPITKRIEALILL